MSVATALVMPVDQAMRQQLQRLPPSASTSAQQRGDGKVVTATGNAAAATSPPNFSPAAFIDAVLPSFSPAAAGSLPAVSALLTSLQQHSASLQSQQSSLLSSSASLFSSHSSQLQQQDASFRSLTSQYASILSSLHGDLTVLAPLASSLSALSTASSSLNRAHVYLLLLTRCNELSELARQQAEAQPQQAAKTILQLSRLHEQVRQEAQRGEQGVLRLQSVLHHRLLYLLHGTKERLFSAYRDCLASMHWPQSTPHMSSIDTSEPNISTFCDLTETLLLLQIEADAEAESGPAALSLSASLPSSSSSSSVSPSQSPVSDRLWIFDLLFSPLHLRFQYHFTGEKPTNRLDKLEWALAFISNVVTLHAPVLDAYVQPILLRSPLAHVSAQLSLIASMLRLLRGKLEQSLPLLLSRPVLLRHTVDELLSFESQLRAEWRFPEEEEGVTELLCKDGRGDVFERWLSVDKEWVNDRLRAMQEMKEPWKRVSDGREADGDGSRPADLQLGLDDDADSDNEDGRELKLETDADGREGEDDAADADVLAAAAGSGGAGLAVASSDPSLVVTRSAQLLVTLVSSITSRFTLLPYLSARLRFVQDIQYQLLDIYLETLEEEAARLLPAVQAAISSPSSALRLYCMIVNSLFYVERVLADWSDDVTFIELRYFQAHSELPASTTVRQLVERIGGGGGGGGGGEVDVDGSVFDAMIVNYHDGRERMVKQIVDALVDGFYALTRAYRKQGHQGIIGEDDEEGEEGGAQQPAVLSRAASAGLNVSAGFVPALLTLKLQLLSLHRHLSSPLFQLVWTRTASRLDTLLFSTCVQHRFFSSSGARQLAYDMNALLLVFRQWGGGAGVGRWLGCVMDAMQLLSMKGEEVQEMERGMEGGDEDVQWLETAEEERRRRWRERWRIRRLTEEQVRDIVQRRKDEQVDGDEDGEVEVQQEAEEEEDDGRLEDEEEEEEQQSEDSSRRGVEETSEKMNTERHSSHQPSAAVLQQQQEPDKAEVGKGAQRSRGRRRGQLWTINGVHWQR